MYRGKKQLIWLSLMTLLLGISALVYAQDDTTSTTSDTQLSPEEQVIQHHSELPRADVDTSTQTSMTAYGSGWDTGYKSGYNDGKSDHDRGAEFDAKKAPNYKGYRSSYNESIGKRSEYKDGFKNGFNLGYEDGYSGRMSRLITTEPSELARTEMFQAQPSVESSAEPQDYPSSTDAQERSSSMDTQESSGDQDTQTQSTDDRDFYTMDSERQSADIPNTDSEDAPSSLPRTASNLPWLALIGLAGIGLSLLFRALRSEA